MVYKLSNKFLSITIKKVGTELSSLKSQIDGKEYLWQGDPSIWSGQAPILFPIIGCLKNGETFYQGKAYAVPKHGLVRRSEDIQLVAQSVNSLHFLFHWNEETLKLYPFKFRFEVIYELEETRLKVIHRVTNLDEKTMLYSLGGHPAFNFPKNGGEEYEDGFIEFDEPETEVTWLLEENGLVTEETEQILTSSKELPLHKNLFDRDALIFKNLKSRKVWLKSRKSGPVLSVEFEDFDYLGIWAKPAAPYVCIEPWLGIADSIDSDQLLENKEGILRLEPGAMDIKTYSIHIL